MRVGIIGGGCFWKPWDKPFKEIKQCTPYGEMADVICVGRFNQHEVFTLQRHGGNYETLINEIPWCANVYGMFLQRLDFIIHVTASGALREGYKAGDLVLFDQLIDFTRHRPITLGKPAINKATYFDFSKPISETLIQFAHKALENNGIKHHIGGTMLCEDGPKFSSMAESKMYQMLGADFVNQTSCPEVYFCRELALPVLAITMTTNGIELNKPILGKDISDSIVAHKDKMPEAIKVILENLPNELKFEFVDNPPYDVGKFDLRTTE